MIQNDPNSSATNTREPLDAPAISGSGVAGFLQPERVIRHLNIRPGMVVADFGCGSGHFTIPAARAVGGDGKVFAIDVQKQAIDFIKSLANLEHLLQVEPIWADLEAPRGSRLPEAMVDFVIISNILFQAEKKRELLAEAKRILRPGGELAMIEWDETPFPAGPSPALRIPKSTARTIAEGVGFTMEKEFDAGSHHYGLLFKKQ